MNTFLSIISEYQVLLSAMVSGIVSWLVATKKTRSEFKNLKEKLQHEDKMHRERFAHELKISILERTSVEQAAHSASLSDAKAKVSAYLNQPHNLWLRSQASSAVRAASVSAHAEQVEILNRLAADIEAQNDEDVRAAINLI